MDLGKLKWNFRSRKKGVLTYKSIGENFSKISNSICAKWDILGWILYEKCHFSPLFLNNNVIFEFLVKFHVGIGGPNILVEKLTQF